MNNVNYVLVKNEKEKQNNIIDYLRVVGNNENKKTDIKRDHCKSTAMDCLHSEEEIQAVYDVFEEKFNNATTISKKTLALRNLTIFVCNINLGLRGEDFCSLRWNNIFEVRNNGEWEYLINPCFMPEKTSRFRKYVHLVWNSDFEEVMSRWLKWKNENVKTQNINGYIFDSQKKKCSDGSNDHITAKSYYKVIEETRKEAGIRQKIGNHGCRKTMANRFLKFSPNKYDGMQELCGLFGHSDIRITERYACSEQESIQKTKERMAFLTKEKNETVTTEIERSVIDEFQMYAQIIAKQHDLSIEEVMKIIKKW